MARRSPQAEALLITAVTDPGIGARFRALVHPEPTPGGCLLWTGAISGAGHGRFWLGRTEAGRSVAVIAHRFAWALAYGAESMLTHPVIEHRVCDNPLCQQPAHLHGSSIAENTQAYYLRRGIIGNALRDVRGSRARAEALRQAARSGRSVTDAEQAGTCEVDQRQTPLF